MVCFSKMDITSVKVLDRLKERKLIDNGQLKIDNGEWEGKTLEQVSKVFGRGKSKHRPRNDKKLYGGNYSFVQTGDIRNSEHFITHFSQTYNETGLAQSKLCPILLKLEC